MGNLFDPFDEENDPAARIAGLIFVSRDQDDQDDQPGVFAMTVRVPSNLAAMVVVMAEHSGLSRNEMVKLLLKAGIQESLARVPKELVGDIVEEADQRISDFI